MLPMPPRQPHRQGPPWAQAEAPLGWPAALINPACKAEKLALPCKNWPVQAPWRDLAGGPLVWLAASRAASTAVAVVHRRWLSPRQPRQALNITPLTVRWPAQPPTSIPITMDISTQEIGTPTPMTKDISALVMWIAMRMASGNKLKP